MDAPTGPAAPRAQSPVMTHLQVHEQTPGAPDGPPGVAGELVPSAEERLAASEADRAAQEQRLRDWQADLEARELEARESGLQEREATERARQDEREPREANATRDAIRALDEAARTASLGHPHAKRREPHRGVHSPTGPAGAAPCANQEGPYPSLLRPTATPH